MEAITDSVFFTIIVTLVAIGILVAVHEAGHFFVARWCKVKVLRFSVGFGKPIWRRLGKDGTEYVIASLPLGGYVRMLDTRNDQVNAGDLPYAFDQQNVYKRIAIVAAGPLINLLFAALLYGIVHLAGVSQLLPVIGEVQRDSVAAQQGMQPAQQVIAIDGVETNSWQQVHVQLLQHLGDTGRIDVTVQPLNESVLQEQAATPVGERSVQRLVVNGPQRTYTLPVENWLADNLDATPVQQLGWQVWRPQVPVRLDRIVEGGAAQQAGLQVGDLITHINNEPVPDYVVFVKTIQNSPGGFVEVRVERDGLVFDKGLRLQSKELEDGRLIGLIGVGVMNLHWPDSLMYVPDLSVFEALRAGMTQVGDMVDLTLNTLRSMLFGKLSVEHLSGPISIAQVASSSAAMGWVSFVTFMAYLSVSLGVLNLLPVPMLDGGHLMYYLIEMVTGKPVPDRVQQAGLRIGMALVLSIMLVAIFNDLARL